MREGDEEAQGLAGEDELPVGEPQVAEVRVILRRRLWQRMARPVPAWAGAPPRGLLPPL